MESDSESEDICSKTDGARRGDQLESDSESEDMCSVTDGNDGDQTESDESVSPDICSPSRTPEVRAKLEAADAELVEICSGLDDSEVRDGFELVDWKSRSATSGTEPERREREDNPETISDRDAVLVPEEEMFCKRAGAPEGFEVVRTRDSSSSRPSTASRRTRWLRCLPAWLRRTSLPFTG